MRNPLLAPRGLADAGLGRQCAFAQNCQEALHGILSDHERIGLTRFALLQLRHLCDGVVEADMVRQENVGVFLLQDVAVFRGRVGIELKAVRQRTEIIGGAAPGDGAMRLAADRAR